MSMTDLRLGAARLALKTLELKPDFAHKADTLKKFLLPHEIQAIKEEEAQIKAFNEDCKASSAMLSAEAATYWDEVKALIRQGKANQVKGNDRAGEKRISLAAEALAEAFDARVPDYDKPKFLRLDVQRHEETWDDRWSYVEYEPPLLDPQYEHGAEIPHVKNYAQRVVLDGIVMSVLTPEETKGAVLARMEQLRLARATTGLKEQEAQQADWNRTRKAALRDRLKGMTEDGRRSFKKEEKAKRVTASAARPSLRQLTFEEADQAADSEERP